MPIVTPKTRATKEANKMKALLALGVSLSLCAAPASAQLSKWKEKVGLEKKDGVSESDTASGLKEALHVGAENAVKLTGREDGYFGNEAIKIPMPDKLRKLDKGLRRLGQGELIDEFVLGMNRAAEKAAPLAKEIFWDAIKQMDFANAREILAGSDTAATDYFRTTTSDQLSEAFLPVVKESMQTVGVTRQYEKMMDRYQSVPFAKSISFDVDQYTVDKALDGLFYMLAEEEGKIRTNPAAQVTDLLKKVFGQEK